MLDKGAAVLADLCTPVIRYSSAHPSIWSRFMGTAFRRLERDEGLEGTAITFSKGGFILLVISCPISRSIMFT